METDTKGNIGGSEPPREAYLYWIHCNRCFDIYVKKQRRHFILACHHVACEQCVRIFPNDVPGGTPSFRCPVCHKHVRGRQLGNMIPKHIKELFHPEPWLDDLPIARILQFQQRQRQHFLNGMKRMHQNYIRDSEQCEVAAATAKKKFEEYELLCRDRKQLERRVRQVIAHRKQNSLKHAHQRATGLQASENRVHTNFVGANSVHDKESAFARKSGHNSQPSRIEDYTSIMNFSNALHKSFNL